MEKIQTSTYSFEKIRKGGYVYVDKTDLLWRLVSDTEGSQFFIARPRRFGKSLMLSTLQCIFEGRRELFKGLKIAKKKYDWKKYPVVMLNKSADAAVRQIRAKGYADQYKGDRRPVTLVGINFRAAKRNIDEPKICAMTI